MIFISGNIRQVAIHWPVTNHPVGAVRARFSIQGIGICRIFFLIAEPILVRILKHILESDGKYVFDGFIGIGSTHTDGIVGCIVLKIKSGGRSKQCFVIWMIGGKLMTQSPIYEPGSFPSQ